MCCAERPAPAVRRITSCIRSSTRPACAAGKDTPARHALFARLAALFEEAQRLELTGMEAWFDLPRGRPPPARWRMAVLTWLGIWPLVSLSLWLVAPHLARLPFLLQTALNSALLVLAMTYLMMPWLTRLAAGAL